MISLSLLVFRHAHEVIDDVEVVIDHIPTSHDILAIHQSSIRSIQV